MYLVSFTTMQLSMVAPHRFLFAHAAGVEIIAPTTTTAAPNNANVEVFMVGHRLHDRDILECLWGAEVAGHRNSGVFLGCRGCPTEMLECSQSCPNEKTTRAWPGVSGVFQFVAFASHTVLARWLMLVAFRSDLSVWRLLKTFS